MATDMTSRPSTAAPILAVLAVVLPLLLFGLYVGGYFLLGEGAAIPFTTVSGGTQAGIERRYGRDWLRKCFEPAAWAEAKLRLRQGRC
jgi:hypothetical protein